MPVGEFEERLGNRILDGWNFLAYSPATQDSLLAHVVTLLKRVTHSVSISTEEQGFLSGLAFTTSKLEITCSREIEPSAGKDTSAALDTRVGVSSHLIVADRRAMIIIFKRASER
jgi:hypothetical protein